MLADILELERRVKAEENILKRLRDDLEKLKRISDGEFAKEFVKRKYIRQVHVDEEGYFSECPDWCDDCIWLDYISPEAPDFPSAYKDICETFTVTSRKTGRVYTYYRANEKAVEYIASKINIKEERAKEMQRIKNEISKLEKELEELRKKYDEALKKDAEEKKAFEKAVEVVKRFIQENELEELYNFNNDIKEEGTVIAEASYNDEEITAVWFENAKVLGVYRKISFDWWGTTYYSTKERAREYLEREIQQRINNPSSFFISSLLFEKEHDDKVTKIIAEDEELKSKAIENYIRFMTKTELSEEEIEELRHNYAYFSESWRNVNAHGKVCEALGIAEEVDRAVKIRKQKLQEYLKKKEEERIKREEQELRELEQKIKEKIHQNISLVKKGWDTVEVKIERCDRDTFYGIVSTLKKHKGVFNYRTKTWTLRLKELGVE